MMSSEALDIPSLSTLILASPKTDIIQCVGRILRKKHESPIIVDIIDSHSTFQNQWTKRKEYYKKCNYKIQKTKCDLYLNTNNAMLQINTTPSLWKTLYSPNFPTNASSPDELLVDTETQVGNGKCLLDLSTL
jgi:superfamily II DNA or RNA helicase